MWRVARQVANQPVFQCVTMAALVVVQGFYFHARHVHTGRAVPFAAFAADAQIHGVQHLTTGQRIGTELTAQGQTQGVGAPAREMLFITRDAVTWAHGAHIKLTAGAIVVAHLHRLGKTQGRVPACARCCGLFGGRIVVHVPGAPVERRLDGDDLVGSPRWMAVAHQPFVVHLGRIDHALGRQQLQGVHGLFDLAQGFGDLGAKLPRYPFAAAQAVPVFPAVSAFEVAHQGAGLFGNGAHLARTITAHIENRAHMQRAHRRMGIPSPFGAVFFEDARQSLGVLGQTGQGHGAVFNEADRFAVTLQAHHDVQAGFAHIPQIFLRGIVDHFHHTARQTQVPHQLHQLAHLGLEAFFVGTRKFHQQNGFRLADQRAADGGCKGRILQRQINHGAVHQLHRSQGAITQLNDVLRSIHGFVEAGKVHHAQDFGTREFAQAKGKRLRHRQGALAAHQQVRQVHGAIAGVGALVLVAKNIQVVARHTAQDFGPMGLNFRTQIVRQLFHKIANLAGASGCAVIAAPLQQITITQPGPGAFDVVHHVAVGNGATAA